MNCITPPQAQLFQLWGHMAVVVRADMGSVGRDSDKRRRQNEHTDAMTYPHSVRAFPQRA